MHAPSHWPTRPQRKLLMPHCLDRSILPARNLASLAGDESLFAATATEKLERLQAELQPLAERYDVVVANPPYMGSKNMNRWLGEWIKENYADVKSDLFSSFIVRNLDMGNKHAQLGFMTPYVWMFISSYEKLRKKLISQHTITSLIQLEYSGFAGATVPICTFTLQKNHMEGFKGGYIRLSDFPGADQQAPRVLEALANPSCGWLYRRDSGTFITLPSCSISYWLSEQISNAFKDDCLSVNYVGKEGVGTRNDDLFMRNVWEVSTKNIGRQQRWIMTDKAGGFQKWHLTCQYVMDWQNDGYRIKNYRDKETGKLKSRPQNTDYLFKPGVSWGKVGSGEPSFRYREPGFGFNDAAPTLFGDDLTAILAYLNTSIAREFIRVQGETLNLTTGIISSLPLPHLSFETKERINRLSLDCVSLVKVDNDSFEISPSYRRHPLL